MHLKPLVNIRLAMLFAPALLVFVAGLQPSTLQGQVKANLETEIGKILKYDMELEVSKLFPLFVAVVDGPNAYLFEFGNFDYTGPARPDTNSLFETGSVTKALTAGLLCRLASQGYLQLDDPLSSLLPDEAQNAHASVLTLQDLLLHTSGLPKLPNDIGQFEHQREDPFAHYPDSSLFSQVRSHLNADAADRKGNYSHLNYALLEHIIERATGQHFRDVFKAWYTDSLGIEGIRLLDTSTLHMAPGHDMAGKPISHRHFRTFSASEGVAASISGLKAYLQLILNREDFLSMSNCFSLRSKSNLGRNMAFGAGWLVMENRNAYPIFAQHGSSSGHSAFLGLVLETHTGVAILSTSAGGVPELGMLILRMLNDNWKRDH